MLPGHHSLQLALILIFEDEWKLKKIKVAL